MDERFTNHDDPGANCSSRTVVAGIRNHSPVSLVRDLAEHFEDTHILVECEEHEFRANAKNLMELLKLGFRKGTKLLVTATGPDARLAASYVACLLASREDLFRDRGRTFLEELRKR